MQTVHIVFFQATLVEAGVSGLKCAIRSLRMPFPQGSSTGLRQPFSNEALSTVDNAAQVNANSLGHSLLES